MWYIVFGLNRIYSFNKEAELVKRRNMNKDLHQHFMNKKKLQSVNL